MSRLVFSAMLLPRYLSTLNSDLSSKKEASSNNPLGTMLGLKAGMKSEKSQDSLTKSPDPIALGLDFYYH
ncbi:MAG: hypothetical protein ACHP9Y_05025 [Gammaproteobacteria bacterium]